MFGIGGFEFLVIIIVVFLIFGPERMAEGAKTVGKMLGKLRDAQSDLNKTINADLENPSDEAPFKKSVEALDKFGRTVTKTVSESTFVGQKAKVADLKAEKEREEALREEEQALRKAAEEQSKSEPASEQKLVKRRVRKKKVEAEQPEGE